jgi:calcineurin-like phosphoesterase family protein
MDSEIIKKWNQVVSKKDLVIHLGDFSLTNKENTKKIFNKLNGKKWLILGNHDKHRSLNWWQDIGFERIFEFPVIYKDFYILSHQPVYMNATMPYVNIHGHTHSKCFADPFFINVSVEVVNYQPVLFTDIVNRLKKS